VPRVSVTIITLNESAHIAAAVDSAAWADEVVVVDAGSSDETVAIARSKGVRVSARDWTGYVDQKNHAASLASHDWIFSLDADERITPPLAAEIRARLTAEPPLRGYRVPRVTFHLGRWVRTTDFYPDYQTRLYDRRAARWQGQHVHESVTVDGGVVGQLTSELQHYSYRDLRDHLDRINRYTTLAARQMHESGRRAGMLDLLLHPPAAFLRNYVLRRGFADGAAGLTLSLVNAYSVLLKFAKLWEMQHATPNAQSPTPKP
jgi:glycosyltransferase involved in cell wall biosynthesis